MAELTAVIFDQDGVIADTERDGHRVAFNRAFAEFGLDIDWDPATYGSLLKVGGGKERMRHYITRQGPDAGVDDLDARIADLHRRKTDIFMEIVQGGELALRPGVARLVRETHEAGLPLAVCSTSNQRAVNTLVRTLLGEEAYGWFDAILAGDVVKAKKPAPDVYNLAQERLGLEPAGCVVIEDNANGLAAAKGARMRCVVTVNDYTRHEDLSAADLVVTCLGDPDGEQAEVLAGGRGLPFEGCVTIDLLRRIAERE